MSTQPKFIIYYEPPRNKREYLKSITLSFSRMNQDDNTYKLKLLQEHRSKTRGTIEEYKMTEVHVGADTVLEKIEKINFDRKYHFENSVEERHNRDYYYISFGDKSIETDDEEEIKYILDLFEFNELTTITHKHYTYIKDMYEYLKLFRILESKLPNLDGVQLSTLSSLFKPSNPYLIFQSMNWLPRFLNDREFPEE